VDWQQVLFRAGNGGDGCISFLHLINCLNAGPDGGDGGNGAHIILRADAQVKSLASVATLYRGDQGGHGEGKDIIGASGEHQYVPVPVGTLVKTMDGVTIADLDEDQSMFIAARGGRGGKGNHFYLSDKNRHPRVAEVGAKGEINEYILEMKCVADCGFVGFPNVGKSTLLRAISRARPRVACYPFTTLNPYVGVIQYDDYAQLSVADLPGLIPDAHKNRGLGIDFLKHVERCVCLMFVIDLSQDQPWNQIIALKHELECFKSGLSKQPHAIVGNKIDIAGASDNLLALKDYMNDVTPAGALPLPVIPVSAKFGENVKELADHIRALFDLYKLDKLNEEDTAFRW
jgi:GTP-binding protein